MTTSFWMFAFPTDDGLPQADFRWGRETNHDTMKHAAVRTHGDYMSNLSQYVHGYMLVNHSKKIKPILKAQSYVDGAIPVESVSRVYVGPAVVNGTFSSERIMRILFEGEWYDCHPANDFESSEWAWPIRFKCQKEKAMVPTLAE